METGYKAAPPLRYVEQRLKIEVPEALMERLFYGKRVEVFYPDGRVSGVLMYLPGITLDS
jgi:hypothetical protein